MIKITQDGVFVQPREPYIQRRHVDGPLLCMSDGGLHWLTLWERLLFGLGLIDARTLDLKYLELPHGRR
jgi:hypothetical protein